MKPILVLRHVPHEGPGLLADLLREAGLTYSYLDLYDNPPRQLDVSRLAALVVMGGPMNVDETARHPFLAHELEWIRAAVQSHLPVLGICLGAQLLAKALGARVYPAARKEIGWHEIELTEAAAGDPLFAACGPRETVFQWHGDTFDLPAGAVCLAQSAAAPQQAFRYGRSAWGLQFHIEITPALLDLWLREPGMCAELAGTAEADAGKIRSRAADEFPRLDRLGRRMLAPLVALCRGEG
jgi:GMP synthase (glutamine-hydrolysing)